MQKIIAGTILLLSMLILSATSYAMQQISDSDMESITGQAGVSIQVDDFKEYENIQGLWYTDPDGLTSTDSGASFGITKLSKMVHINDITSYDSTSSNPSNLESTGRDLQGQYFPRFNYFNHNDQTQFISKPITIDATSSLPALSSMATYNRDGTQTNLAGVHLGLGTLEMVLDKMDMTLGVNDDTPLDGSNDLEAENAGDTYGTLNLDKWTFAFLDGTMEIAPPTGDASTEEMASFSGQSGIRMTINDFKMYMDMKGLWYTDPDGLDGSDNGASIGLKDLSVMVHINTISSYDSDNKSQTGGLRSIGRPLQGTYSPDYDYTNYNDQFVSKPLTIDVTDTLPVLSSMATNNNDGTTTRVAGVHIGLGTMEIVQNDLKTTIGINDDTPLDGSHDLSAVNKDATYGTINQAKQTEAVLDGNIEIAPH